MTAENRLEISDMMIRREQPGDIPAIRAVLTSAFRNAPHSSGNEAAIVDGLREGGALTISLIAEDEGELVGHVAFSPIKINAEAVDWYSLGPIAVRPDKQRHGIGRTLIEAGLDSIRSLDARGCVVLGDPAYYGRFGFRSDPALRNTRVPAEYFQQLSFGDEKRRGIVEYHPAFFASEVRIPTKPEIQTETLSHSRNS
jgi:putative acetyltransferase